MSGNVDRLLACVAICGEFRPGSNEADRWRREFARLYDERRDVEKRLILDDRARAALMAADAVILSASAPTDFMRGELLRIAGRLMTVLSHGQLFDGNGMFIVRDTVEVNHV